MNHCTTSPYSAKALLPVFFVSLLLIGWLILFSACRSASDTNQHPRAPEPGTYRSATMKTWMTVTPNSLNGPTGDMHYGVGSMSMKGMFGDLILRQNGTYALTGDKREGTWRYIPEKDSVAFTGGVLSIFRIKYDCGKDNLTIYTGGAKMDDGGEVNIRYTKKREKPVTK